MVRLLLEQDVDIDSASPDGKTALTTAAMFNRVEIVEHLLDEGANALAQDANGTTPLTAAATLGATGV